MNLKRDHCRPLVFLVRWSAILSIVFTNSVGHADDSTLRKIEFFESRIRPVLVEQCYECHNSAGTAEGELAVDHRSGLRKGGASGKVIVPGDPANSRLLPILRHEIDDLKMPQDRPKLSDELIADFERWIADGAVDPRDHPPDPNELSRATGWTETLKQRKQWWSFQPIRHFDPPTISNADWQAPIDRFVLDRMQREGLSPSGEASADVLVRRLYFTLIGLPPTADEMSIWTKRIEVPDQRERDRQVAVLVNELLDSPHFGERWARHWMDWIRYAESHGSEGDPRIENAWFYRDYLIRALNRDVPYDQLVREHVAGDLLEHPRINDELELNESVIGTAHWRMVFHGFAPTDALDEKVRFTDDQINAFTKAFLGLTVSCARCHNHKFDPISQADYYALFGILGSCRPGRLAADAPDRINRYYEELRELKPSIRAAIAQDWLASMDELSRRLDDSEQITKDADNERHLLYPVRRMLDALEANAEPEQAKLEIVTKYEDLIQRIQQNRAFKKRWDLGESTDYSKWFTNRTQLSDGPLPSGNFAIATAGDSVLRGIYPAGCYSHEFSEKQTGRFTSPEFHVQENEELWCRVIGDGGSTVRYVVQNYPRNGTVYPVSGLKNEWRWQRFNLSYWAGDDVHVELTTGMDAPLLVRNNPRSWFGVREVIVRQAGEPEPADDSFQMFEPIVTRWKAISIAESKKLPAADIVRQLTREMTAAIRDAIVHWQNGNVADSEALMLDACLRHGLLPNGIGQLPTAEPLVRRYRELEEKVAVARRTPGLDETVGRDQPLFIRGNHKKPGEPVPRRFLEAIDPAPYQTILSGRLELANDLLRPDNPLVRRAIVNRIWHHLFGRGIVDTPDNFGQMGSLPSHPELLDWLALQFEQDDWSIKKMIRRIVLSRTWRQASRATELAMQVDPRNQWLSHAHVRRLEAEAIRDSMLRASGILDDQLFGPPVDGNANRRSVYVRVIRNNLDPFLRNFDFPEPFTTTGRRDATNVPAQSLTMMNDKRVAEIATAWANAMTGSYATQHERIRRMFATAFGRTPTEEEVDELESYLESTRTFVQKKKDQLSRLKAELSSLSTELESIKEPIRKRLLANASKGANAALAGLRPVAAWDFRISADDRLGHFAGTLQAGAALQGGLVLRGKAHLVTSPLPFDLHEKTLEAWVQLDTLDQRGGGVMTIQTLDGVVFDSIVFGEQEARHWLAGSDRFTRTQSFGGSAETDAHQQPVHIAITYHKDGTIVGYRNGKRYGKAYKSSGPIQFKANEAVVSFGLRHLPADGNKFLHGKILRANLYDRPLTDDEVAASASGSGFVSEKEILAELSPEGRERVTQIERRQTDVRQMIRALQELPLENDVDHVAWTELAKTLFVFEEFIYLR